MIENYTYLDWAATTPICPEASAAMLPFVTAGSDNIMSNANANSLHQPGRKAFMAMEECRMRFARTIGVSRPDEIIFTSGATEADNLAVIGLAEAATAARARSRKGFVGHVIVSSIEHDAVLQAAKRLSAMGYEVTYLKPDSAGFITLDSLQYAIRDNTVLVSIMFANNEIGSVQDIKKLCAVAHKRGALFHTDAVQAFGKVPLSMHDLGIDAASFSAHKVCGPKGVGALYLKARTKIQPMALGGGQELGKRSGTQNVMGIAGFTAAAERAIGHLQADSARLCAYRDKLYGELCRMQGVQASVPCEPGDSRYAPHIVNVTVKGIESETLILQLDLKGFGVSGGSACSSGSLEPSHVLTSIGMNADRAICSLRISLGTFTTEQEIDAFIRAFKEVVDQWS